MQVTGSVKNDEFGVALVWLTYEASKDMNIVLFQVHKSYIRAPLILFGSKAIHFSTSSMSFKITAQVYACWWKHETGEGAYYSFLNISNREATNEIYKKIAEKGFLVLGECEKLEMRSNSFSCMLHERLCGTEMPHSGLFLGFRSLSSAIEPKKILIGIIVSRLVEERNVRGWTARFRAPMQELLLLGFARSVRMGNNYRSFSDILSERTYDVFSTHISHRPCNPGFECLGAYRVRNV